MQHDNTQKGGRGREKNMLEDIYDILTKTTDQDGHLDVYLRLSMARIVMLWTELTSRSRDFAVVMTPDVASTLKKRSRSVFLSIEYLCTPKKMNNSGHRTGEVLLKYECSNENICSGSP